MRRWIFTVFLIVPVIFHIQLNGQEEIRYLTIKEASAHHG